MPVKKPLKKVGKAAKQTYLCLEPIKLAGVALADPRPRWVLVDHATDAAWFAKPLDNPKCPILEYPKFAWQESKLPARAKRALSSTWQTIGFDVLGSETASIYSEEVQEAVSSCGFIGGYPEMYGNDKEAVAWLELQPEAIQDLLLAQAFPPGRYGL